jgi:isopenicillin N synthase-like dioxygenase
MARMKGFQVSSDLVIPIIYLEDEDVNKPLLLKQIHDAAFNIGFFYIGTHGVHSSVVQDLVSRLPVLFDLSDEKKLSLSKLNSPHFLGYNSYAEEITLGKRDLREQFDFATELPVVWVDKQTRDQTVATEDDYTDPYWRLRGPNQWPDEVDIPGFKSALTRYCLIRLCHGVDFNQR